MDYVPFSNDGYDNPAGGYSARQGVSHVSKIQIALFFVAVVLCFGFAYWFATTYPDKMREILITVDRFGITEVGATEQLRVYNINRLPNTEFEKKEALINRTVFLGASMEMVQLALGQPVCKVTQAAHTMDAPLREKFPKGIDNWIYFIQGDSKPTRLVFDLASNNGSLVSAEKVSALDICSANAKHQ